MTNDPEQYDPDGNHRDPPDASGLVSWDEIRREMVKNPRVEAALNRLVAMDRLLYSLWLQRGLREPKIFEGRGLEAGEFVGVPIRDELPELYLADLGRFVAGMGGHLEVRAVFKDQVEILLSEPGPEHLYDGAS